MSEPRKTKGTLSGAVPRTRLEAFMKKHGIEPVALERASGLARQHLMKVRSGKSDVRRSTIVALVRGCRTLIKDSHVTAFDLFELE